MKKMENYYKWRIIKAELISALTWFIGTTISLFVLLHFGLDIMGAMIAPMIGVFITYPVLSRQDNIILHFERLLKKERARK